MNNRVSPTVELLIRERSKGKSLRQLGQMFGRSHERVRQLLAKNDQSQVTLLPESRVAAKLGYPRNWLILLLGLSAGTTVVLCLLFLKVMTVPLPRGMWIFESFSRLIGH